MTSAKQKEQEDILRVAIILENDPELAKMIQEFLDNPTDELEEKVRQYLATTRERDLCDF